MGLPQIFRLSLTSMHSYCFRFVVSGDEQNLLERTMPVLQKLELHSTEGPISSNVTFPWYPELLELPLGLKRSSSFNDAYSESIGIAPLAPNIYRYHLQTMMTPFGKNNSILIVILDPFLGIKSVFVNIHNVNCWCWTSVMLSNLLSC